jgi:adenylate cyclase
MAKETERKFLIQQEFRHLSVREISIIQAYLSVDPERTIRIRIADQEGFITIKGRDNGKSFARNEWEYPILLSDANEIMKLCLPGIIQKTRYIIPFGDHLWEVDVFHGKNEGLVIAEIELASEDEQFEKPGFIGEEVTGKPEYNNSNLIK